MKDSRTTSRGFTLIEVIISIAIVLMLIFGINQAFRITSQTVGTGQALSATVRDARAAQTVFYSDLGDSAVVNQDEPFMMLMSCSQPAFRNRRDELGDRDQNVRTWDRGDGDELPLQRFVYNDRNHRVDVLSFFARGVFDRQTGNHLNAPGGYAPPSYAADMSAREAWIVYGHLNIPGTNGFPAPPGSGTRASNPDNYYASDWILGRNVILLTPPGTAVDRNGLPLTAINDAGNPIVPLPITFHSFASDDPRSEQTLIRNSRYDLALGSIDQYRRILQDLLAPNPNYPWAGSVMYRFAGDPQIARPLTLDSAALTAPVFLRHCTSFIVEYAGNFVQQDGDGNVLAVYTEPNFDDDEIDFIVETMPDGQRIKRIRWYGYPRDTTGPFGVPDGVIRGQSQFAADLNDVVPLRDVWRTAPGQSGNINGAPFEKMAFGEVQVPIPPGVPGQRRPPIPLGPRPDYGAVQMTTGATTTADDERYYCVWGPDPERDRRPMMLRIILKLDDPNGRLADGQTFEYIIKLP